MVRFMICDTDTVFLDKLAAILHRKFDPCSIEYLYGPAALEAALRCAEDSADVLLTEVELRGSSAISIIAQFLRESSPLQVIYMTPHIEYCTEVYDTRHCGFLLKPVKRDLLFRSVRRALQMLEERKIGGIVVQHGSSVHILVPQSLLYVESRGRILKIVTDHETLETYDKMTHFSFHLDKRFLQCHKSFLVNMERVRRYFGDRFQMADGTFIPISQSRRKEVREQFLRYMGCAVSLK